ncbi:serine hydrolase domain-containing protein [Phyllobacterium myrsinacearum]|uniref:CubicO group peptidase (Beta-lactamase class C family) n=1 Tax=Phyllobacterium myrsinacearum TaxID=28101 RepID=A0A839EFE9_9HYPH|nr:serine hydrolase domain-containing protein [Phyllobacterium myrsinacearum]MBA8878873.1 CubicO group peptidase (beta-lactamase class C family) [Phyllobacterium myrsinacearum]
MSINLNWMAASTCAGNFASQWPANEPGGAIMGFDTQGIRFAHAGGLESLATRTAFSADSVVRFASVTKHVFAAMVFQNSGLIGLDDRLGDHLGELQPPLADVTVGRALDMSGGLPDVRECLTLLGLSVYTETQKQPLLDFLYTLTRLNFDAGTDVSYSNTGYRLVEAALERKGLTFDTFVQNEIADPLGIFLKAPEVWIDPVQGLAPGYFKDGENWQLSAAGLHISAAGSLAGSARSLTVWLQHLLAGKDCHTGLLAALSGTRFMSDGRPSGYGLGLRWSELAGHRFVGHGGSHPGYKSYFLLDPEAGTGFVAVSNRDDTNGYKIALAAMGALMGLPLPQTNCGIPDGLYVTETGPYWIEVAGGVATYLDAEDTLYDDGDGWFSSRSASSPMRLRWTGTELEGEAGYVKHRFLPVKPEAVSAALNGHWVAAQYGARFDISDGVVMWGIGPARRSLPLTALGNDRFLFTLNDGPWRKRICLHRLADGKVELVLSRSRMMEYTLAR